jgi:hypothetical protein
MPFTNDESVCRSVLDRFPSAKVGKMHFSESARLDHPITITVLREPVARTIAHISALATKDGNSPEDAYAALDRDELPFFIIDNLMTRFLTAAHERPSQLEGMTYLVDCVRVLEGTSILGLSEHLDLMPLSQIGVSLPVSAAPHEDILPLSDKHIETIRALNKIDCGVYDCALEILGLDDYSKTERLAS